MTAPTSKASLEASARQIRDETLHRNNTATRVGTHLLNVVDAMPQLIDVSTFGVDAANTGAVNDAGIALAIAAAIAASADLYWPAIYPSAANITSLHSVRHRGPGGVSRGGNTFYVQPKYGQSNTLFVATTGSANNDGLTTSQPMLTPGGAFAALRNYGPMLDGTWTITLAAGTWSVNTQTMDTPSRDWVVIKGPAAGHPNVPTAILDGTGAGSNNHGFVVNGQGVQLWVQDIKFQNYNAGAQNSCGIAQGYAARVYAKNVHCSNCDFAGVLADQGDILLVGGGIYTSCRSAVIGNATKVTVGYGAASTADGTQISSSTQNGVYWSRGTQGHIDYCIFDQNPYHVVVESAARAHIKGNDFRRASTAAINTNSDGSYYDDVSVTNNYNDGTGNANTTRYKHNAYSGEQQTWLQVGVSEMRVGYDDTLRASNSASKTTVATPFTIPANWFTDTNKKIRVKIWGQVPAFSGVKVGVDLGSVQADQSTIVGTPGAVDYWYECEIYPSTATVQRSFSKFSYSNGNDRIQDSSVAAPAATGLPVNITFQVPTNSATMLARRIEVFATG